MKRKHTYLLLFLFLLTSRISFAVVHYDRGRIMINGVQLMQVYNDPLSYQYIPQYPRLARKEDGTFELLCIKYVGQDGKDNGGLFHALVEFTLPSETIAALESELQSVRPGAKIVGPVDLLDPLEKGEEGAGSFQIVSSVLSNQSGENPMTSSLVTSGYAPLTPGSKAVVAAMLNQEGATLLWDSFTGPTSDVSVAINAQYEAAVKAYNAVVKAEMSVVYEHYSRVLNQQQGYQKKEIRKISDELVRNGVLEVEVLDRSEGLDVEAGDMEAILQLVTDKLTELMFDAEAGWAVSPDQEVAVGPDQIAKRQERGFFGKLFAGTGNQEYITDNQFVLKRREDIRTNTFYLNLSKATTIRVPVHTSGNLSALFDGMGEDRRYFRIVNMDDPDFEQREIHFQVDGNFVDSFQDLINFASVNFRKKYPEGSQQSEVTKSLVFNYQDIETGTFVQSVQFPRLGINDADWTEYEFQIDWSLKGSQDIVEVPGRGRWQRAKDPVIALIPPFEKKVVEIDADRGLFQSGNIASAIVEFAVILNGEPKYLRSVTLRAGDADPISVASIYHDPGEQAAYRVTWYSPEGKVSKPLTLLESSYLFLIPPSPEEFTTQR